MFAGDEAQDAFQIFRGLRKQFLPPHHFTVAAVIEPVWRGFFGSDANEPAILFVCVLDDFNRKLGEPFHNEVDAVVLVDEPRVVRKPNGLMPKGSQLTAEYADDVFQRTLAQLIVIEKTD
jgi:hypothetical protein